MAIDRIALLDTETTDVDPDKGRLIEVAVALWSVPHAALIKARSWLVRAESNAAEAVNGIPAPLLTEGIDLAASHDLALACVRQADVVVAHHADFDRQWFSAEVQSARPWVCSCHDIEWPRSSTSRALTAVALAHGVGIVSAHRALSDVMTLAALFGRVAEMGTDVREMLTRAMRPKKLVAAILPFDRKDEAKEKGFTWHPHPIKEWRKKCFVDDIPGLGFEVREVPVVTTSKEPNHGP